MRKLALGTMITSMPCLAVATIGLSGMASVPGVASGSDRYADLPDQLTLNATIRDFRGANQENGHPDFQPTYNNSGYRVGMLAEELGPDGLPVPISQTGRYVGRDYRDNAGRKIAPHLYDPILGDAEGALEDRSGVEMTSFDTFNQWYRDVPGVNASTVVPLTLTRQAGTNVYVFDSDQDEPYRSRQGFFPIDGELFGNYHQPKNGIYHNYHFSTMIDTEFMYTMGQGHVFTFSGDDDVWVFIDGRLVIDLGGTHPRLDQTIELDRLDWLADGRHSLKIFHVERRFSGSNFRMETTLQLRSVDLPNSFALFD